MSTAPETTIDETHSATAGTPLVSRLLARVSGPFRQFEDVLPWELGALTWYSLVLVVVENGVLQAINA